LCFSPFKESVQNRGGWRNWAIFWVHGKWTGLVAKLVWRVKLVAEVRPGVVTETEVGRIERDDKPGLGELGLQLAEMKQLGAALQAEIVPAQMSVLGERCRVCVGCGGILAGKGHYPATFRSESMQDPGGSRGR
jgi:hypothetical protein